MTASWFTLSGRRLRRGLLVASAAAAVACVATVPAGAVTTTVTWNVSNGGTYAGANGGLNAGFFLKTGSFACNYQALGSSSVTFKQGNTAGSDVGHVSSLGSTTCDAPAGDFSLTMGGFPWQIHATALGAQGEATVSGRITGIHVGLKGTDGCRAVL